MKDLKLFASLAAVAAVIALVVWMIPLKHDSETPKTRTTSSADSVSAINDDLDQVQVNDIDPEFKDIDRDLNSL